MIHLATITVSSHKRDITVPLIRVRFTMPTLGDVRPLNTFSKKTTTDVCVSVGNINFYFFLKTYIGDTMWRLG